MAWRLARSLVVLGNEIDAAHPDRSKALDGTIGDADHRNRCSRHNPNDEDVVLARDFTHDPAGGCDIHRIARDLVAKARRGQTNPDFEYCVSNGEIASRSQGWVWRDYTGDSQHIEHAHFAVGRGGDCDPGPPYDSTTPWGVTPKGVIYTMLFYGKRGTVDTFTAAAAAQAFGATSTVDVAEAKRQEAAGGRLVVVGGPACRELGESRVGVHNAGATTFVLGQTATDTGRLVFTVSP